MMSGLLIIAFAIAVFACLFLYMAIGMAVGDFQANVFLGAVLAVAAIIGGVVRWRPWRSKKEP